MSVVKVINKSRGTRGQANSEGQTRYTTTFQVLTDSTDDGPITVGAAIGINAFDAYTYGNDWDYLARAKEIEIERSDRDPFVWEVTVNYDSKAEDWDENPLLRPPIIDYDFQPYERVATTDTVTGKPIVNAAGMLFDPPIMVEDSRLVISIERNELVYPLATAIAYQNALNSDPWFGLAPLQGKILISGKFTKEGGFAFYTMRYETHVRWETWTLYALNYGLTNNDGSPCTEKDGTTPVSEPVPLSTSGTQLPWPINTANINQLNFNVLNQLPFSALGLP